MPHFTKERDFIVYDHRGVGKSIPNLERPEIDEAHAQDFGKDLSIEDHVKHEVDAVNACGERLRQEGHNLDVYNTQQTALDMEAIKQALGYGQINIFSYSYATYLTLTYMRLYPEQIRSVIMDSAPIPRIPKLIYNTYNENYTDFIEVINAQQAGGHVIGPAGDVITLQYVTILQTLKMWKVKSQ